MQFVDNMTLKINDLIYLDSLYLLHHIDFVYSWIRCCLLRVEKVKVFQIFVLLEARVFFFSSQFVFSLLEAIVETS